MARCRICGQRLYWGGRRFIRLLGRADALVTELQRTQRGARAEKTDSKGCTLPEAEPVLNRLIYEGGTLIGDLHEAAHEPAFVLDRYRMQRWQMLAKRVLSELKTGNALA